MSSQSEKSAQPPLPTTPEDLFKILQDIDIQYEIFNHEPIFTVQEGEHLKAHIPGMHCRNLFVRDKKERMFLIVAANETAVDLKKLPEILECGRLSFGSAGRLYNTLGIHPGSVCPFVVVNDREHKVKVLLDKAMMSAEVVNYHPMDNAMTISLTPQALLKFFDYTGHTPRILDFGSEMTT